MGHRALVAYQRPDHLYDLRYSHWGGQNLNLLEYLTVDTPLAQGRIDAEILADSVALDAILTDFLDPCGYETLYLVDTDFDVRAHRVCWLALLDGREQGRGALVAVESRDHDCAVRRWFRATKTTLSDVVEMGGLTRRGARQYLERRLRTDQHAYLYRYGERGPESATQPAPPFDTSPESDDEEP